MLIAVAGCVAQAEGAEIVARQPAVDMVVGPQSYHRLPEMIAEARARRRPCAGNRFPGAGKIRRAAGRRRRQRRQRLSHRAGRLRQVLHLLRRALHARRRIFARPSTQILAEARSLAARGVREITLLGQNVNAYRGAGPDGEVWSLARLIAAIADDRGHVRACATRPAIRATWAMI